MADSFFGPGSVGGPLYQAVQRHDRMRQGVEAAETAEGVAPPGWERSIKRMKKHKGVDNPYALCLVGDTSIPCLDGTEHNVRELAETEEDFWVYAFDQEQFMIVPGLARARFVGLKQVYEITLDNKETILCSPEHRWVLRDGAFIPTHSMKTGMCLMPFKTMYEKSDHERIYQPGLACYVLTHWSIMRVVNPGCAGGGYLVHHKNENPRDNRPMNLEWVLKSEHHKIHGAENVRLMREAWNKKHQIDKEFAEEHAQRGRDAASKLWRNPAYRKKMIPILQAQAKAAGQKAGEAHKAKALERKAANDGLSENHKIRKIRILDQVMPMYDVAVDGYHTFAVSAGVFSHNSWWLKRTGAHPAKNEDGADAEFDAAVDRAVALNRRTGLPKEYHAAAKGEVWAQSMLLDTNLPLLIVEHPWK